MTTTRKDCIDGIPQHFIEASEKFNEELQALALKHAGEGMHPQLAAYALLNLAVSTYSIAVDRPTSPAEDVGVAWELAQRLKLHFAEQTDAAH